MEKLFKTVGKRIAQKRHELHLSQEQFATIAGVHRNLIGNIERAETKVSLLTLYKIAKAFNMTLVELLKGF